MTIALVLDAPLLRMEHEFVFAGMRSAMGLPKDAPVLYVLPNYRSDSERVEMRDVEQGGERLRAELADIGADIVVAFGTTATWALCGTGSHLERLGKWQQLPTAMVMPTHHPALLCRRPELSAESSEHLADVLRKLGDKVKA
jgi:uracil-DNA glycosylase